MRRRPALRTVLSLALAALAASAGAAPRRADLRAQAQALARAARDERALASGWRAQAADLRRRLEALDAADGAPGDRRSTLAALARQEAALRARLEANETAIARLLRGLALDRRNPPPALLAPPQSVTDAVRAQILAQAMAAQGRRRSQALAAQMADIERQRRSPAQAGESVIAPTGPQAQAPVERERMAAEKEDQARRLLADAQVQDARLAALARASGLSVSRLASAAQGVEPLPQRFVEPVQGRLAARFGQAAHVDGRSEGLTWRSTPGAPVLAPAAGVIDYAGPLKDYGVVLILRASGPWRLVLAGLGSSQAAAGRRVLAGEPVGRLAEDAGPAPELYLELRKDGDPVDPGRWFKASGEAAGASVRASTPDSRRGR
jgi:septal ring factor EnvC (AmiA/AmiB activator)